MQPITVKEEMRFDYNKKKKVLIVYKLEHLTRIMGTTSVSGNLNYYKIKKQDNHWEIPVSVLKNRMIITQERIDKYISTMNLMRQVKRQIK